MFWTYSLFLKDQVHTPRLLLRTSWDLCDAANVAWYLTHKSSCVTIVLLTKRSSFYFLSNPPNKSTTRICTLVFIQNCTLMMTHNEKWGHWLFNDRANTNCVTSSSPTTGLRTIHLLRSILFRALPWHAIPVDTTLCLHPHFNVKNSHKSSFGMSSTTLLCLRSTFNHRSGNSHWISSGLSEFALTQFNLPVVISMMKHRDFTKVFKTAFCHQASAP